MEAPLLHPSADVGEAAVRSPLNVRPREVVITDAGRARNMDEAHARWKTLFAEPEPAQRAQDLQRARDYVDHALAHNDDAVPHDVQEMMVESMSRIYEVDRALRDGPGNIVPSDDAQGFTMLIEKDRVRFLGDYLYEQMRGRPFEKALQYTSKITAIGLLLGVGGCAHHAHMALMKMAVVVNRNPALKGRVKLTLCTSPLRDPADPGKGRRDHAYGRISYLDDAGAWHHFRHDPWPDEHRLMLARHDPLEGAFEEGDYLQAVDDDKIEIVWKQIEVADKLLPHAVNAKYAFEQNHREVTALKAHAAGLPMHGYYMHPIGSANPGVVNLLQPRASLRVPSSSPLLSEAGAPIEFERP